MGLKQLLVTFLFVGTLSFQASALDEAFNKVINKHSIENGPGFVAGVYQKGQPVFRAATGLASIEMAVPIRNNHIFRIASLTKQFTAVAILKLAQENKLQLDDDLHKYLKDYPTENHKITIAHLLSHTSGLSDFLNISNRMETKVNEPATLQQVLDEIKQDPILFPPGEATAYSNTAYILLGKIIEIASGMSYSEYLRKNFFKPLSMNNSLNDSAKVTLNHVSGYGFADGSWTNAESINMTWAYSAGELASTIDDMARWFFALSSGKILEDKYYQKMITPFTLNNGEQAGNTLQQFGFGLMCSDLLGMSMIGHTGNINGFNTYAEYSEQTDSYVVVLVNTGQEKIDSVAIARELSAIQNNLSLPDFTKVTASARKLKTYSCVYTKFGVDLELVLENGAISVLQDNNSIMTLLPMADGRFFTEGSLSVYEFAEDKSGQYMKEYMYLSSSPFRHDKVVKEKSNDDQKG